MTARITSIQIGKVITEGDPDTDDVTTRLWSSAFDKRPVSGPVMAGARGIEGDEVANTKHHGGIDKAVLCYSANHYARWNVELPDLSLGPGAFAENLTISGRSETNVCIGDRYQVGDCEIEVSQPRQPCWKIARRWACKTLPKEVVQTGRTGWYVRVTKPGRMEAGDAVTLTEQPHPTWTIARINELMLAKNADSSLKAELVQIPLLAQAWKDMVS